LRGSFWAALVAAVVMVALGGSGCVQGPAEQTVSGERSVPTTTSSAATASASASAALSGDSAAARGRIDVWMKPSTDLRGRRLHVSSATSLMDGSVVHWEVGRNSSSRQWDVHQSGTATVADGSFRFSADTRNVPGRKLYVFLMFSTRGQSKAVIERYGDTGQYVTGNHLEGHGEYRTIEYWVGVSR
jgi:hypothetical protein